MHKIIGNERDQLNEVIELNRNSDILKTIVTKIETIFEREHEIESSESATKDIRYHLSQKEEKLSSDIKLQINDALRLKCEEEIQSLQKELLSLNSGETQQKNEDSKEECGKLKEEINSKIFDFIKSNGLNLKTTYQEFYEVYKQILKKIEFEDYRKKATFNKVVKLSEVHRKRYSSIVIRVNWKEEKKYYSKQSNRYYKGWLYAVEDDTKALPLIIWDKQFPEMEKNVVYEIKNIFVKEYEDELQLKVTRFSEIKEIV